MKFLRTRKATGWTEASAKEPWWHNVFFRWIPKSNPDYEGRMHLVREWIIEFLPTDSDLEPWREIGLDADGKPVISGPDQRNYGFWCDTNARPEDFNDGAEVSRGLFERLWLEAGQPKQSTVVRREPIDRPISPEEMAVISTALRSAPAAPQYVSLAADLDRLRVVARCGCGCESVEFATIERSRSSRPLAHCKGETVAGGTVGVIVRGDESGVTCLEVYDLGAGDMDLTLPIPASLRFLDDDAA